MLLASESDVRSPVSQRPQANISTLSLPLYFEENRGQTDPRVRFVSRAGRTTTFFRDDDVVMRLPISDPGQRNDAIVRMQFLDTNENVELGGNDRLPGHSSYFQGSDPNRWISDVAHFSTLSYGDIYSGIDLVFHGVEGRLRYDFKIAPGADPAQIRLGFDGVKSLVVADNGDLVLQTLADDVIHKAPLIYQDIDGIRYIVEGAFHVVDEEVRFRIGSYDTAYALVIDPTVFYSTYLGGTGGDSGRAVRVDPFDNSIVVTGQTASMDFPLDSAEQPVFGGGINPPGWAPNPNGTDGVFLWDKSFGRTDSTSVKITASTRPVATLNNPGWRTSFVPIDISKTYTASVWVNSPDGGVGHIPAIQFLDGSLTPLGTIGAIGPSGFPPQAPGWIQRSFSFGPASIPLGTVFVDIIVVQDIDGTQGTPTTVFFDDVVLEESFVGPNIAPNPSFSSSGTSDVFVSKLTADGSSLVFSTYLGGSDSEIPQNVELDSMGNILIGGRTSSADFPTTAGLDQTYGGPLEDGFLTKLTPTGSLDFSTFVGGIDVYFKFEEVRGIAVDSSDNIWIIGNTGSPLFEVKPIINPLCVAAALPRSSDIFVRKYSPTGTILISTCFGGSGRDAGRNIALDSSGDLVVTGWTESGDFPTTAGVVQSSATDAAPGTPDGWVAKLDSDATAILAATYLGGTGSEFLEGLGVDSTDNVVVSGASSATNYFTTTGAFQETFGGTALVNFDYGDGVVTKLNPDLTSYVFSTYLGGTGDDFAWGLKLDSADRIYVTGPTDSMDFPTFDPLLDEGALAGPTDAFISQLNPDGSALEFSSFLGGTGFEFTSNGVFVAAPGDIYVTGSTDSGDFVVVDPLQMANAGGNDAFITRIFTPLDVPVTECTTDAGGCNPTGAHEIQLPEGFVVPAGAELIVNRDDRIDERVLTGRCGMDSLTITVNSTDDVTFPPHICAADADGRFAILSIDTNIEILEGTVLSTMFPDAFFDDALSCDPVIAGDPQEQDVVVWQPDFKGDLIENRAIELTFGCGSSRARTRRVSHFFVGMQINFGSGFDFAMNPSGVIQKFVGLTSDKLARLQTVTNAAAPALTEDDHDKLQQMVKNSIKRFDKGDYGAAVKLMKNFLRFAERADFDTGLGLNHQGNLLMRGHNIKFMIEVKVIPFVM